MRRQNHYFQHSTGRKKIALIEDSDIVARGLSLAIHAIGYEPHAYVDPLEGLLSIRKMSGVALVMTDLWMAPINGIEIVELVRTIDKSLPIITISGHAPSAKAKKIIADDDLITFIQKPFGMKEFASVVSALISVQKGKDLAANSTSPISKSIGSAVAAAGSFLGSELSLDFNHKGGQISSAGSSGHRLPIQGLGAMGMSPVEGLLGRAGQDIPSPHSDFSHNYHDFCAYQNPPSHCQYTEQFQTDLNSAASYELAQQDPRFEQGNQPSANATDFERSSKRRSLRFFAKS